MRYHTKHVEYSDNNRVVFVRLQVCQHITNQESDDVVAQATGTAICHPDDKFNYRIGRDLALARAMKQAATELAERAVALWDNAQEIQRDAYNRVNNPWFTQLTASLVLRQEVK